MKPKYQNRLLRSSLLANIIVSATVLSSSAIAADVFWDGSTDSNWNTPDNWSANRVPVKLVESDNAIINTLTNFPIITADLAATPRDIKVGTVSGASGRVDHRAGSVSAGSDALGRDWVVIGEDAGQGTYNLADTSATGGSLTGFGTGSGNLTAQRLYVTRAFDADVPNGELAVNTSGSVKVFNDMYIGDGGNGTVKWDAGTLNRNGEGGWMVIGQGGSAGNGTFNIGGGTINAANDTIVGRTLGSTGNLNQTGGIYNAGGFWVGRDGGTGTWTVSGATTQLNSTGEVYIGGNTNSNGTLQINSGAVAINNWVNVGRDGGNGNFEMSGGSLSVDRELRIGFGANNLEVGGVGSMTVSGGAQITAGIVSEHIVIGGNKGSGTATVDGLGTKLSSVRELRVGNNVGSEGQLTVSGGTVESGSWLGIGRDGSTGTLTIEGTGVVNQGLTDTGSRLELTNNGIPSTATLNLDGGTLSTNGITSGSNGTRNVFLNGGVLKPRIQNYSFLEGMTNVTVTSRGAFIDTASHDIMIAQSMIGVGLDGGLTKSGTGTLFLNGTNTYTGTTTATAGELSGDGSVDGPLMVQVSAIFSPGYIYGPFGAKNTTVAGSYSYDVEGLESDVLNVTGTLNLSATTDSLDFRERGVGATLPLYVIANYTSRTGTFDIVNNLPPGYTLNYGSTQMTISRPLTPFETWAQTFFPGETDPTIIGAEADPDEDGQPNNIEFALGGVPNNGANNAKIYHLTEDSSDAGIAKELLITIAVRDGGDGAGLNPVFAPVTGGNPTATQDGMIYTIEGGVDLVTFPGTVSVVNPVTAGLPTAPMGYEYRTFSLDGSNGLPSRGFMRVSIAP
ncbi:MAG: autotransporter-associated beta strand repeat-containing protein [Luteolibacter sp.]